MLNKRRFWNQAEVILSRRGSIEPDNQQNVKLDTELETAHVIHKTLDIKKPPHKVFFAERYYRSKTKKETVMITRNLNDVKIMENAHNVYARNIYNTPDAMITVITLMPGQSLKRHITPVDVAFYVLSGKGIVEIGNEKQEVAADTLVESPKDIVHCWYNESSEPLRFMIVKAPRPTRKTVFLGS